MMIHRTLQICKMVLLLLICKMTLLTTKTLIHKITLLTIKVQEEIEVAD